MAASVPSPSDEFRAPLAVSEPDDSDLVRARSRGASGFVGGRRPSWVITLAATWILAVTGCADRPLVLVGRSTMRDGLVGLWHFDETTGTTAVDSSGHENHGTLKFADTSAVWVPGRFGNALAVEGGGYAQVPWSLSIDGIASGVTISAWMFLEDAIVGSNTYGTAISRQIGTGIDQYYHLSLHGPDATPNLFIGPAATTPLGPTKPLPVPRDTWVHLAGTWDETTEILYVNGEEVGRKGVSGRFPADSNPVILGGNFDNSNPVELFPGRIDEITLYNRPLSPLEIEQLAQAPVE